MDEHKILLIQKRGHQFFVKDTNQNGYFWKQYYPYWEDETFAVFDRFLDPTKEFLDIGGWIGTTCLYASEKSSRVVVVEADPLSVQELTSNISLNTDKIQVESSAISNTNSFVVFGRNKFRNTSELNDSTSQIKQEQTCDDDIKIPSITLSSIIEKYSLRNLSLIKIDIEGGEEAILDDLYEYHIKTDVPIYISFHYSWWSNKNLDRFTWMDSNLKQKIQNDPFCTYLLEPFCNYLHKINK